MSLSLSPVAGCDQAALNGFGEDTFAVESAAVVGDLDHHQPGLMLRLEQQARGGGLAVALPVFGTFDAVIERVAHHVHQRIGELFDDGAVEFDIVALRFHHDVLAELAREIAHETLHAAEQRSDGHQAHCHRGLLQLRRDARKLLDVALQARIAHAGKLGIVAYHRFRNHHFACHIHQIIELGGVHADRGSLAAFCGGCLAAFRSECNVAFRDGCNVAFRSECNVAFRSGCSVAFRDGRNVAFRGGRTPAFLRLRCGRA